MAIPVSKCLIFAFAALIMVSASIASNEVPFMVVHKKASLNRIKSAAERVSVSIDIYNQGSSTAYDVTLTDESWAKDTFKVVGGNISKSWERLDAGGILSHSFDLESNVKGVFSGAPAVVTFRIPTKSALQVVYSTPILPLDILAEKTPENKLDLAKKLLARFGPLVSVISIVALFVHLISSPSKSSKKKH